MNRWSYPWVGCLLLLGTTVFGAEFESQIEASFAEEPIVPTELVYKKTPQGELRLFHFQAAGTAERKPVVLMIHGGGFKGGKPTKYFRWCRYLAAKGIESFSLQYRVQSRHEATPAQCLEDAKSAIRWIRKHATTLGIDPDRIAVGGSSAGGHLAAALSVIDGFNAPDDPVDISCRPNLILLIDPVIDNGITGYGHDRVKEYWNDFSPIHNLREDMPPTIGFIAEHDPLISLEAFAAFGASVEQSEQEFRGYVLPGRGHGSSSEKQGYLTPVFLRMYYEFERFLHDHGYLNEAPPAATEASLFPVKEIASIEYRDCWRVEFSPTEPLSR